MAVVSSDVEKLRETTATTVLILPDSDSDYVASKQELYVCGFVVAEVCQRIVPAIGVSIHLAALAIDHLASCSH